MSNFDLDAMGVHEMNLVQAKQCNGGLGPIAGMFIGALIGWAMSQDLDRLAASWKKGWEAGMND